MTTPTPAITFRADLHCHTTCSDGSVSPEDLVKMAVEIGLQGLSITDHDTLDAYETAWPLAKKMGLEMIPGVELSTVHREVSVHVLAYSFSLDSILIRNLCERHRERRQKRNRAILDRLGQHGKPVTDAELQAIIANQPSKASVGRPHIALAMIKKGYVGSVDEAFKRYLGEDKPCYVRGENISTQETLDIIHEAKGLAILAHPHLIERSSTVKQLLQMNFDGIEAYYAKFPPQQESKWLRIGKEKNWIVTGGSDFHGEIKPYIPLGCSWIREETFRLLQTHFLQNSSS